VKESLSIEIKIERAFVCGFGLYWGWQFAKFVWDGVALMVEVLLTWAGIG